MGQQFSVVSAECYTALNAFVAEYWARVDNMSSASVSELFTADGVMQIGSLCLTGKSNIHSFFTNRNTEQAISGRFTRHVFTGLRIQNDAENVLKVSFNVMVFAGFPPTPSENCVPVTIADFTFDCIRSTDNDFLIQRVSSVLTFSGPNASSFAKQQGNTTSQENKQ